VDSHGLWVDSKALPSSWKAVSSRWKTLLSRSEAVSTTSEAVSSSSKALELLSQGVRSRSKSVSPALEMTSQDVQKGSGDEGGVEVPPRGEGAVELDGAARRWRRRGASSFEKKGGVFRSRPSEAEEASEASSRTPQPSRRRHREGIGRKTPPF
jgi:hypothetical protein